MLPHDANKLIVQSLLSHCLVIKDIFDMGLTWKEGSQIKAFNKPHHLVSVVKCSSKRHLYIMFESLI